MPVVWGLVGLGVVLAAAGLARRRRNLFSLGLLACSAGGVVYVYPEVRAKLGGGWRPEDYADPALISELKAAPAAAASAEAGGAEWPQWRGPNRDGVAGPVPLAADWGKSPPKAVWEQPCGGGYSSVAVAGGRAYLHDRPGGQDRERVRCFDAGTGQLAWEYAYDAPYSARKIGYESGPRATPAVHGGRVYCVGALGQLLCLEADPGGPAKVIWRRDLAAEYDAKLPQWGIAGSPLIEGDLVVVQPGGRKGTVAAFDRVTGEPRWAALDEATGYSSPVAMTVDGQRQLVCFTADRLVGLDPADGDLLWDYEWRTQFGVNAVTPLPAFDRHVFISSDYGTGCALLKLGEGGVEPVWVGASRRMKNHFQTSVVKGPYLYGCDNRRLLKCLDLRVAEGEEWEERAGDCSLILCGDKLVALNAEGTLSLVKADPAGYELLGEVRGLMEGGGEAWANPALVGNRLYLRNGKKVVCLELPLDE